MNFEKISTIVTPEQQFNDKETVKLYGGKVEIVDIKPEQQKSELPVVMFPGWRGTPEMYKNNILALAEAGRRTISVDAARIKGHNLEGDDTKEMGDTQLRKIAALKEILDKKYHPQEHCNFYPWNLLK